MYFKPVEKTNAALTIYSATFTGSARVAGGVGGLNPPTSLGQPRQVI